MRAFKPRSNRFGRLLSLPGARDCGPQDTVSPKTFCSKPSRVASASLLAERMVLCSCHGSSRMWFLW